MQSDVECYSSGISEQSGFRENLAMFKLCYNRVVQLFSNMVN